MNAVAKLRAALAPFAARASFLSDGRRVMEVTEEELAIAGEVMNETAPGWACWRMGCQNPAPDDKVGCDVHRMDPDEPEGT